MVKKFTFPSYEEWKEQNWTWTGFVGDYNCKIAISTFGKDTHTYQCAISVCDNPTDIYSPKIFNNCRDIAFLDELSIKSWYEEIVSLANRIFSKYIENTYLGMKERY